MTLSDVIVGVMVAEQVSFEGLFRAVFPRLVSMGAVKTGSVDTAREIAQEAMLRAHRHWDSVCQYTSPEAWCVAVMANLLIDHHRAHVRQDRLVDRLRLLRARPEAEPTLSKWNDLVEGLPDRQRLIVTLYYGADWSVAQIADSLGTTEGGVKASLFKARESLRQQLKSEDLDV